MKPRIIEALIHTILLSINIPFALRGIHINIFACGYISGLLLCSILNIIKEYYD